MDKEMVQDLKDLKNGQKTIKQKLDELEANDTARYAEFMEKMHELKKLSHKHLEEKS